jgi:type IV pilus assembly protein PilB
MKPPMNDSTSKRRLAEDRLLLEALMRRNVLTPAKAKSILNQIRKSPNTVYIEDLLTENQVEDSELLDTLVSIWNIPSVSLNDHIVDVEVINLVPAESARKYMVFPLFKINDELYLAMADPKDIHTIDVISQLTRLIIKPAVSTRKAIHQAIQKYYGIEKTKVNLEQYENLEEILEIIKSDEVAPTPENTYQIQKSTEEAPVVRMTNMILYQALLEGASDIHISPEENQLRVRIRVDGQLKDSFNLPKQWQQAIISRIKIMANLDIAEQRIPQDGQFGIRQKEGQPVTFRVSSLPVNHGEDIVLRILDKDPSLLHLENLGCETDILEKIVKLLNNAYGMILVTGPTGSGKTTTLYACLNKLLSSKRNIITLEDPIEYNLAAIRQSQVNPKAGMTFAKGLRAILRHDPDIILVGEIRDTETAEIAIQASMTGHLVLSTLHTNDAISSVSRLLEMGIESFLLSSALLGVQAQRLVRKICSKCKEPASVDLTDFELQLKSLHFPIPKTFQLYQGKGCEECRFTGYSGRLSIMEVISVNESMKQLIARSASTELIQQAAFDQGMRPLLYDGWRKVFNGLTTIEEIMRVMNF